MNIVNIDLTDRCGGSPSGHRQESHTDATGVSRQNDGSLFCVDGSLRPMRRESISFRRESKPDLIRDLLPASHWTSRAIQEMSPLEQTVWYQISVQPSTAAPEKTLRAVHAETVEHLTRSSRPLVAFPVADLQTPACGGRCQIADLSKSGSQLARAG